MVVDGAGLWRAVALCGNLIPVETWQAACVHLNAHAGRAIKSPVDIGNNLTISVLFVIYTVKWDTSAVANILIPVLYSLDSIEIFENCTAIWCWGWAAALTRHLVPLFSWQAFSLVLANASTVSQRPEKSSFTILGSAFTCTSVTVPDSQHVAHHWAAVACAFLWVPDHHVTASVWWAETLALRIIKVFTCSAAINSVTSPTAISFSIGGGAEVVVNIILNFWLALFTCQTFAWACIIIKVLIFSAVAIVINTLACTMLLVPVLSWFACKASVVAFAFTILTIPVEAWLADDWAAFAIAGCGWEEKVWWTTIGISGTNALVLGIIGNWERWIVDVMDDTSIQAFYWRLDAFASTSIPLLARSASLIRSRITYAMAVFVMPNLVACTVTQVKADALIGFHNPKILVTRAGAGCILARTVWNIKPFCSVTWGNNTIWTPVEDSKLCFRSKMCLNLRKIGCNCCMGGIILWICCIDSIAELRQHCQRKGDSFHLELVLC